MIKAANTIIGKAFGLREHLRVMIAQSERFHQPRVQITLYAFRPDGTPINVLRDR